MDKINIDIPKGYSIDMETSDFSKGEIIFKKNKSDWKNFGNGEFWYLNNQGEECSLNGDIGGVYDWDFPTKKLLISMESLRQLLFWRNRVWKNDNDWEPNESDNLCIDSILRFRTNQMREKFYDEHKELISKVKLL